MTGRPVSARTRPTASNRFCQEQFRERWRRSLPPAAHNLRLRHDLIAVVNRIVSVVHVVAISVGGGITPAIAATQPVSAPQVAQR